ncbi:5610_t:CDS:10, partial [Funneliformis mosseae]
NITQPNSAPLPSKNPNIYIMDIRNYTWVNSFEITNANVTNNSDPSPSTPKSSPIIFVTNSELGTIKIAIASIGGTLGAVIIIACGFLFYKWNRKRKDHSLRYINEEHTLPGNVVEHNNTYKIYQSIRVPEGLKDVPTLNYFGYIISLLSNEGPDKLWENSQKVLEKEGIGKVWFNGAWHIITTDLGLTKDVFTRADLFPKPSIEELFPGSLLASYYGTNVVFSNGDVWKRHRYIINPAFKSLPMHVFDETALKLLKVIEKVDNGPIEVKDLMHRLTLDVLGRAAFGFDFNNLEDPTNVYATTYKEVTEECDKPIYFILPFLENIPYFYRTEARKKVAKINDLFNGLIETKRKSMETDELGKKIDNNSADMLERMINAANDPKYPMSNEEMRSNLAIFMLAGHDTTANALATVLYVLATHKDVQSKVRDEILRVLDDNLTPTIEQQRELKYMNM